jgi:hypothetical protein
MICINFLLSVLPIHFLIVQKKVGLFHIEAQLFISHALQMLPALFVKQTLVRDISLMNFPVDVAPTHQSQT